MGDEVWDGVERDPTILAGTRSASATSYVAPYKYSQRMKKIAVVEDNPDNRLLVQVILEPLYEVVEYETGMAALEGLGKEKPDLVLLDVSLPEMDGTEVLRRIRADEKLRGLPGIALTAHAMAGARQTTHPPAFAHFLHNPTPDQTLLPLAIHPRLP